MYRGRTTKQKPINHPQKTTEPKSLPLKKSENKSTKSDGPIPATVLKITTYDGINEAVHEYLLKSGLFKTVDTFRVHWCI